MADGDVGGCVHMDTSWSESSVVFGEETEVKKAVRIVSINCRPRTSFTVRRCF